MGVPDACKVQEMTIGELCHQAYIDRLLLEEFRRFVIHESYVGADSDSHTLSSTGDLELSAS